MTDRLGNELSLASEFMAIEDDPAPLETGVVALDSMESFIWNGMGLRRSGR